MAMLTNPGYNVGVTITPSDTANIVCPAGRVVTDAVYVGTKGATGTIVGVTQNDDTITLVGVVAGTIYPLQVKRINQTTTDASDLVALFSV